jgi:precorrin-8X/cobalt-precorrin-8 methylmutase
MRNRNEAVTLIERYALPPDEIEPLSIERLGLRLEGIDGLGEAEQEMVRRLVYATGDPGITASVRIHPEAVRAGVDALLAGKPIITDVKMVRAGIDRRRTARLGCRVACAIDAPEVVERAAASRLPRAVEAMRYLAPDLNGAVAVIGNAPTALLSLLDLVDAGAARPAVIIGTPVGFVAAAESKAELLARDVPYITIEGTRGGSALAVSAVNTLLRRAVAAPEAVREKTAVLFLGHGSRARSASEAMEAIIERVQHRAGYDVVAWGYLEFAEPKILDGVRRCVEAGATRIVAIPYFLHVGMHMIRDLPRVLREARMLYPHVQITMGRHIGLHADLVEVLLDRIAESWHLPVIDDVEITPAYYNAPAGTVADDDE